MRIRTAAIAGASTIAVALSGATAVAEDNNSSVPESFGSASFDGSSDKNIANSEGDTAGNGSLSSKIGNSLDAQDPANGVAIFGSSKDGAQLDENGNPINTDLSSQPAWAQAFYGLGIAAAVVTVIGLAVGPVLNFIKYGPQTQLFR